MPVSEKIHVACAADLSYLPHCAAMISSVLSHNPGAAIHFLCPQNIPENEVVKLKNFVVRNGGKIEIYRISTQKLGELPSSGRISQVMWFRIFLPELLKDIDKVLYLDCDTIVRRTLSELWSMPFNDALIGAVENVFEKKNDGWKARLGLENYFNSGVLLINLKGWREKSITKKIIEAAEKLKSEIIWPDQDILNLVLGNKRIRLKPIWNCQNSLYDLREVFDVFDRAEVKEAKKNPAIVHFEGGGVVKPWHYLNKSPWKKEYLYNRQKTPWPLKQYEGRTCFNIFISWMPKNILWPLLKGKARVKKYIFSSR